MTDAPGTTKFDLDTSCSQSAPECFTGTIADGWSTGRGPNGGYIGACLLRALTQRVDSPNRHVRSLTIHYLAPPKLGSYTIVTSIEKAGRSATFATGHMYQDQKIVAKAIGAFISAQPGPEFQDALAPNLPPPQECEVAIRPAPLVALQERFHSLWAIGERPFSRGKQAHSGGWIRLSEDRPTDSLLLLAYADGWLPAVFSKLDGRFATPTVDLSIHFRAQSDPIEIADDAYCMVQFRTRMASGGFIEEDGEIFSPDGTLLAQSRQLALLAPLGDDQPGR